jgi:hypothetical protein
MACYIKFNDDSQDWWEFYDHHLWFAREFTKLHKKYPHGYIVRHTFVNQNWEVTHIVDIYHKYDWYVNINGTW